MTLRCFDDNRMWRKSSKSGSQGGDCLYVSFQDVRTAIRDSKQGPAGPTLHIDSSAWPSFLTLATTTR